MRTHISPPQPTPIEFFEQRHMPDAWRLQLPVVSDDVLMTRRRRPGEDGHDALDVYLRERASTLSTKQLCTASLNVAAYNRAAVKPLNHPGSMVGKSTNTCVQALTLQLKYLREDHMRGVGGFRYIDRECVKTALALASAVHGMLRTERASIGSHMLEVQRIVEVANEQLLYLEDATEHPDIVRSFKQLRLQLLNELRCGKAAEGLLNERLAEVAGFTEKAPTTWPAATRNIFRGEFSRITLRNKADWRTLLNLHREYSESVNTIKDTVVTPRLGAIQSLCENIALWCQMATPRPQARRR